MRYGDYIASRKNVRLVVNEGTVRPGMLDRETEVELERRDRKALVDRELVPTQGKPRKLMDPI